MLAEQIDYLTFAAVTAVIYGAVAFWLARFRGRRLPIGVILGSVVILFSGWLVVDRAGRIEVDRVRAMVMGFAPTYALELARMGHAELKNDTSPKDARWLAMIDVQKRWLKVNPAIISIYTMRRLPTGELVFVVACAVDYDRNGVYEGQREQPSLPGDVYKDAGPFWLRGLKGETAFDDQPYTDEWGTWVSAVTPMYDAAGNIEAVLGVDYDAATFVRAVVAARGVVIATVGLFLMSLLSLTVIVMLHRAHLRDLLASNSLRRAKEVAEESNKAKSEFLSNMSHELRTPMHAIMSFSKLGKDKVNHGNASLDKLGHYFSRISDSSDRLLTLLDDLLDLSKMESGKMTYQWGSVDLEQAVAEMVSEFDAVAHAKGVRLLMSARDVPMVHGDRLRLGQVMRNHLSNAIKFTAERSTVQIVVSRPRTLPEDIEPWLAFVQLSVRDEGIGIPPDELEAVFDKFVQSSKTKSGAGGTGLGLSIVRAIISDHGGRVWASNNPEGGTTFHVLLPREAQREDSEPILAPEPSQDKELQVS